MNIAEALVVLGGLVAVLTELIKRIPLAITSDKPKYTAVLGAIILIGGYGFFNHDTVDVMAAQVVMATPMSYVVYDVVKYVIKKIRGK